MSSSPAWRRAGKRAGQVGKKRTRPPLRVVEPVPLADVADSLWPLYRDWLMVPVSDEELERGRALVRAADESGGDEESSLDAGPGEK